MLFTAIIIKFIGAAHVQWTEQETVTRHDGAAAGSGTGGTSNANHSSSEIVTYKADEEYYSFKYNLVGGGNSKYNLVQAFKMCYQSILYWMKFMSSNLHFIRLQVFYRMLI